MAAEEGQDIQLSILDVNTASTQSDNDTHVGDYGYIVDNGADYNLDFTRSDGVVEGRYSSASNRLTLVLHELNRNLIVSYYGVYEV